MPESKWREGRRSKPGGAAAPRARIPAPRPARLYAGIRTTHVYMPDVIGAFHGNKEVGVLGEVEHVRRLLSCTQRERGNNNITMMIWAPFS